MASTDQNSPRFEQTFLDFGQKDVGLITCAECGTCGFVWFSATDIVRYRNEVCTWGRERREDPRGVSQA